MPRARRKPSQPPPLPHPAPSHFVRVALVLPTEFAYARDVLRGIIAATRERNMYAREAPDTRNQGGRVASRRPRGPTPGPAALPWLFRVYRGIYGHSSKYLARWFREWNPDGIIGQIYDDRLARVYRDTRKPVVELFESRTSSEFPRILPDDVATGAMAARHFLERGFRHFAFFGAPWMIWSRERERGFTAEVQRTFADRARTNRDSDAATAFTFASYAAGTRATPATFGASPTRRAAAVGAWLASLPRPLALFAANDLWGFELVQVARELGLHVPDDVAILGVDDEELLCEIAHPPLSSIRMGAEQIGREAVSLLQRLLQNTPPPHLAGSLAGRGSVLSRKDAHIPEVPRIPPTHVVTRQSTDVLAVDDPDVAAALRHIRRRATEGLSVKELLETVPVNRRTLERRFVAVLGHTPLEEIRRIRLERAKALLHTDLPIYDVATRSGYASPEYLATSFLRATGLTPTEYRRQFAPAIHWPHLPPA